MIRRSSGARRLHALDTTHPDAIGSLEAGFEPERTLFFVASRSGPAFDTRCRGVFPGEGGRARPRADGAVDVLPERGRRMASTWKTSRDP